MSWLDELKAGDPVVVCSKHIKPGVARRDAVVTRVTATLVVVGIDRFHKRDGRRVGEQVHGPRIWLEEATRPDRGAGA